MSIRTPNYIIDTEVTVETSRYGQNKILPSGSFVRPIHRDYVPKHVIEKYKDKLSDYYIFIYCFYGIIPISRYYLREV